MLTDVAIFQISGTDAGFSTDARHQPGTVTQEGNDAEMPSGTQRHCRGSWLDGQPSTPWASREEP